MVRAPVAPWTRRCEVRRERLPARVGGPSHYFVIYGLARRARFADIGQVPEFDGDKAFFEVIPKRGTKLGYEFVRQIETPSRPLTWHG